MYRHCTAAIAALIISAGASAAPADSLVADTLRGVTVSATGPRKVLGVSADGAITLDSRFLSEQPTGLGSNDPVAILRSTPAVATTNELQAAICVRGSGTGANVFEADGLRIINPLHFFGVYSTYNPEFFRRYTFRPGRIPATDANCTGGIFRAESGEGPDTAVGGVVSAGLIESHADLRVPVVKGRTSLAVGLRRTYLSTVFPNLLKFDDSRLDYGFSDANMSLLWRPASDDLLRFSFFWDNDDMKAVMGKSGRKDGRFGWTNFAGGISWRHSRTITTVSLSTFRNFFELSEGGRRLDLPSQFTQASLRALLSWRDWRFSADANYRYSSGQVNREPAQRPDRSTRAVEGNLAAEYERRFGSRFALAAGLRLSAYVCGGYSTVAPMPRMTLSFLAAEGCTVYAAYGRYLQFDRLIEESSAGLPADFRCNAGKTLPPDESNAFETGLSGFLAPLGLSFDISAYYKFLRHQSLFAGSILNLVNPGYNPLSDVVLGNGRAYGLSFMAMRQYGKVRGRVSYNIGKSEARFPSLDAEYRPTAHDRLHDLNATLNYEPRTGLTVGLTYTYATGLPYTRALYGYMIGENLICHYGRLNGSRLPDYKRLDVSVNWTFLRLGGCTHRLNVSVYNAMMNKNILFYHTSYSTEGGLRQKRSMMDAPIPSVTYTLEF